MAHNLDLEFPQGDPTSVICRWCKNVRTKIRGALICTKCD